MTFPVNKASMIKGMDGLGVMVGVAEVAGVAVNTKLVGPAVGVSCTANVCATAVLTTGFGVGGMGLRNCAIGRVMNTTAPATTRISETAKPRRARMRLFWRVR